jgi:hypothetical protein
MTEAKGSDARTRLEQFEAAKYRELNDTAGVHLSASEFRWLCDLARGPEAPTQPTETQRTNIALNSAEQDGTLYLDEPEPPRLLACSGCGTIYSEEWRSEGDTCWAAGSGALSPGQFSACEGKLRVFRGRAAHQEEQA